MNRSPFTRRTTSMLVGAGIVSMLVAFGGAALGGPTAPRAGADAYSVSALGHRAYVELLEGEGVEVLLSRGPESRTADDVLLVVAEPRPDDLAERWDDVVGEVRDVLVVLPKRDGAASFSRDGWFETTWLRPEGEARQVLAAVGADGVVARPRGAQTFDVDAFGISPTVRDIQLVRSEVLAPMLGADQGVLLGELRDDEGRRVVVLSDPDLLANHGLDDGRNAVLAVRLTRELLPPGGLVVVDESLHGGPPRPGVMTVFLRPPLRLGVLVTILACGVLLWAGAGRFGAPRSEPDEARAGKGLLVANAASLLVVGGHRAHVLGRYATHALDAAAAAAHLEAGIDEEDRDRRLAVVGARRGVETTPAGIRNAVSRVARREATVVDTGRRIHRWRREMTHGAR